VASNAITNGPVVSVTSPANGASLAYPGVFNLAANASEANGTVSQVVFYNGSSPIATVTQAPYTWVWDNVPVGTYSIKAVATDAAGVSSTSAESVTVVFSPPSTTATSSAPAGTLPGSMAIDQVGAANYSIPIAVPPGTAGMKPNIGLLYNSGGGNGIVGMGWTVTGLSAITRCPETMAQDGVHGGVNLDDNDKFCLDGSRLMATSGTYGADGTVYATELESFVKVVSHGTAGNGPAYFDVWDRNGVLSEYGNTTDSQILALGSTTARVWAIDKVTDPKGNYTTYTYTNDTTNGQYYPATINYTGNANASLTPYNSVQFFYASTARPDTELAYVGGSQIKDTVLLTDIETFLGTGSGASLVFDYHISYSQSAVTGRSHVTSIQQCDSSKTTCLNPTTFTWSDSGAPTFGAQSEFSTNQTFASNGTSSTPGLIAMDVNGDGKTDLVQVVMSGSGSTATLSLMPMLSNGNTVAPGTLLVTSAIYNSTGLGGPGLMAMDMNGDGKVDLIQPDNVSGNLEVIPYISNGTTFTAGSAIALGSAPFPTSLSNLLAIDFDGDGRGDLVLASKSTSSMLVLTPYLSTGTTFTAGTTTTSTTIPFNNISTTSTAAPLIAGDFNGDGRADLVQQYMSGGVYCLMPYYSTSSGYVAATSPYCTSLTIAPSASATPTDPGIIAMDINGDGKTDLILISSNSSGDLVLQPLFSTGTGFVAGTAFTSTFAYATGINGTTNITGSTAGPNLIAMDVNGDGRMDLVQQWDNGGKLSLIVYLSNGTGFDAGVEVDTGQTFASAGTPSSSQTLTSPGLIVVDVDGDGQQDLLQQWNLSNNLSLTVLENPGVKPDVLTSTTNGLGYVNTLAYQPITDSTTYTPPTTAPGYPRVAVQDALYVVTALGNSNGVGDMHYVTYAYSDGLSDLSGRGFLGFGGITSTDMDTLGTTATSYYTYYPMMGRPAIIKRTVGLATIENTNFTSYTQNALGGTRYFVYLAQSSTTDYDLNGAFLTTLQRNWSYDAYGNLLTSSTANYLSSGAAEGYTTTSTNTWLTNTSTWILGLLTQTVTTKTTPANSTGITRTTGFGYDAQGFMTSQVIEPGNANLMVTATYTPDTFGNRVQTQVSSTTNSATAPNILTRTSSTTFDTQGRYPTQTKNALNQVDQYAYSAAFGKATSHTDPNNVTITWTPDTFGRIVSENHPDGTAIRKSFEQCFGCWALSTTYVATTNVVSSTGANVTPPQGAFYDIDGREILGVTTGFDGTPSFQEVEFNIRGDKVRISRPYKASATIENSLLTYDVNHRPLTRSDPDGTSTTYTYNGLIGEVTVNSTQTAETVSNSQGQVVTVTNGFGTSYASSINYTYDPFGDPLTTTDSPGNVTTMTYDIRGHRLSIADPDTGTTTFTSDVLGEVATKVDAKSQKTTYAYDLLGRPTTRTEPDLTSTWTYDSCTNGKGLVCTVTGNNGYSRSYAYNTLEQVSSITSVNGTSYPTDFTYDAAGRLWTITYPTGFELQRGYNSSGYLATIGLPNSNAYYWQQTADDAEGHITADTLGNGITETRTYYPTNGLVNTIEAGVSGAVQNQTFTYDQYHNLYTRTDIYGGTTVAETFGYDGLNRLNGVTGTTNGTALTAKSLTYDATGNIVTKSDVGTYKYPTAGSAGPHAVSSITGTLNGVTNPAFTYDVNGNLTSAAGRTVTWTSYNMAASVVDGANSDTYAYSPEHQRIKELHQDGSYLLFFGLGSGEPHYELQYISSSNYTYRYYLSVGSGDVGMVLQNQAGAISTNYFHRDNLGSVSAVTNDSATVLQKFSYDAWGKRRNPNGTDATTAITSVIDRGYTGHQMMDSVNLINMNGRVYDPALGRFMSADRLVADAYFSQDYNRYSYVLDNPLGGSDPSGHSHIMNWSMFSGGGGGIAFQLMMLSGAGGQDSSGSFAVGGSGDEDADGVSCTGNCGSSSGGLTAQQQAAVAAVNAGADPNNTYVDSAGNLYATADTTPAVNLPANEGNGTGVTQLASGAPGTAAIVGTSAPGSISLEQSSLTLPSYSLTEIAPPVVIVGSGVAGGLGQVMVVSQQGDMESFSISATAVPKEDLLQNAANGAAGLTFSSGGAGLATGEFAAGKLTGESSALTKAFNGAGKKLGVGGAVFGAGQTLSNALQGKTDKAIFGAIDTLVDFGVGKLGVPGAVFSTLYDFSGGSEEIVTEMLEDHSGCVQSLLMCN